MWTRQELKMRAKTAFKANYWRCVLVGIISSICLYGVQSGSGNAYKNQFQAHSMEHSVGSYLEAINPLIIMAILAGIGFAIVGSFIIKILLLNQLAIGCQRYMILNDSGKPAFGELLYAFNNGYGRNILTMFCKDLFISLWTLLLVIPGIVKSYEYRMIPYILAERPELTRKEVFQLSKEMMHGEKWNTFVLDLSFIGWYLLSIITFGLLNIFYIVPYVNMTNAELYLELKQKVQYQQY